MSAKDSRGDLFIMEAWKECVERCRGRIIYVKCCDSLDLGIEFSNDEDHNGERTRRRNRNKGLEKMFVENGVLVDLYSDPLGWDSEDDEHDYGGKIFKGQITKLKSILSTIQQAAQHIHKSKQQEMLHDVASQEQPIPIIFDSTTPLLIHHGVQKLTLLLTHLKQAATGSNPIVSPIFMPTLSEMLPPSLLRILEDYSDAVLTLNGGELSIAKRSARMGGMISSGFSGGLRLTKDVQLFDIEVKENRGSTESKLVLRKKIDHGGNDKKKVTKKKKDVEDVAIMTDKLDINSGEGGLKSFTTSNKDKDNRPILKHEDEDSGVSKTAAKAAPNKPTPRIYMEDDDPEFDDLDEEDPDDDLDI